MKPKLLFPAAMYLERRIVIHDEKSFSIVGMCFHSSGKFSTAKNLKRKAQQGWLLGYDGTFYLLTNPYASRTWTNIFSWLWNAVRTNYDVTKHEKVTVGFVLSQLHGKPKNALDRDFRRFLDQFPKNTLVT
jgi:hypothetical protein